MFTTKFWFVVVTSMLIPIRDSILEGGCKSIETLLNLFFYWDAWLNACVAIERAVNAYKGISFNQKKSKRFARWIIFILPILIMATIIHEPLYRKSFKHGLIREVTSSEDLDAKKSVIGDIWCLADYSPAVQDYSTTILFIHLLGPFIANLFSALFIIISSARRRAGVQTQQTYRQHIREQWQEHKQLVISPIILLLLSTPRLVISLIYGCVDVSRSVWLYLSAYFISFVPSVLMFVIFVLPSSSYRTTFKETISRICHRRAS
ncbi:unnamed protein product [Adineta ricciae]|uniref:G protein-coupled receptor n=2 Tax=Adineta ricciae TaxID=249248 RepID=A0A814TDX1_ADIRI|nr:unnamed protein product [Adineta ricciae]